jgi:hypothetical protein
MIWLTSSGSSATWCASSREPGPHGSGRIIVNGLEESLGRVLAAGCWSEMRSFGAAVSDYMAQGEPDRFQVLSHGEPVRPGGLVTDWRAQPAQCAGGNRGGASMWASLRRWPRKRWPFRRTCAGAWNCVAASCWPVTGESAPVLVYDDFAHHPTAIRTTLDGLRRKVGPAARILAVFEPRTNTMKLGAMKAQLPWSLAAADLAFCHAGALGWDAARGAGAAGREARWSRRRRHAGAPGLVACAAGRPDPVHEQRRFRRHPPEAADRCRPIAAPCTREGRLVGGGLSAAAGRTVLAQA